VKLIIIPPDIRKANNITKGYLSAPILYPKPKALAVMIVKPNR
jgi:hypothetical protein